MTRSAKRGLIAFFNFQPGIEPCSKCKVSKFQVGTILKCHTMDGQTHTIGKTLRPLFADPVTNYKIFLVLVKLKFPLYPMPNITHYVSKISLEKRVNIINGY